LQKNAIRTKKKSEIKDLKGIYIEEVFLRNCSQHWLWLQALIALALATFEDAAHIGSWTVGPFPPSDGKVITLKNNHTICNII
jgi:hypothetical protein